MISICETRVCARRLRCFVCFSVFFRFVYVANFLRITAKNRRRLECMRPECNRYDRISICVARANPDDRCVFFWSCSGAKHIEFVFACSPYQTYIQRGRMNILIKTIIFRALSLCRCHCPLCVLCVCVARQTATYQLRWSLWCQAAKPEPSRVSPI